MYLPTTVFVARLTKDAADRDKESYVSHSGFRGPGGIATAALKVNIQPATAELTVLSEGVLGKTFRVFTTASGLVEGMRITVSGTSDNYYIRGREKYNYGLGQHFELVANKDKR